KVTVALKAQAEGGGDGGLASHRHVVQGVVKAEGKAHHQHRTAHLHLVEVAEQVAGREGPVLRRGGQGGACDLDHGDVDITGAVLPLAPQGAAMAVEGNGESGGAGHVVAVDVKFDGEAVGEVAARFVAHHVAAGDQEEATVPGEKESTGTGEGALAVKGAD